MATYHLAQVNIARLLAPLDSPQLVRFVSRLADVNALADQAPGFVWRLQTEDGDATSLRPYPDDRLLLNLSVWEGPEALHRFVFQGPHSEVMRQRREWFSRLVESHLALWWVPEGHQPSVEEAKARLEYLREHGPTALAFTFQRPFPSPNGARRRDTTARSDRCPAG
jgi:hypothetical protein